MTPPNMRDGMGVMSREEFEKLLEQGAERASVRPVLTYAFFPLFAIVETAALYVLVNEQGLIIIQVLP